MNPSMYDEKYRHNLEQNFSNTSIYENGMLPLKFQKGCVVTLVVFTKVHIHTYITYTFTYAR